MEIVLRTAVIYLFLWGLTRALGKRELAEISVFELLLLVVVGDLVQQGVTQEDMSVTGALLAVSTIAVFVLATSYLGFRLRRLRPALEGNPVIVIRDGRVLDEALRIERVTRDELDEAARRQGIADLRTVELGVLEADGKFSFVPSSGAKDDGHER